MKKSKEMDCGYEYERKMWWRKRLIWIVFGILGGSVGIGVPLHLAGEWLESTRNSKKVNVVVENSDIQKISDNKLVNLPSASEKPDAKGPISFNFGSIPFGKSIDEILKRSEVEIKEVDIDPATGEDIAYGYEDMRKYLPKYLNINLIKLYRCGGNKLYFVVNPNGSYTLFMVHKTVGENTNVYIEYENFFRGVQTAITEKTGVQPLVFRTTYNSGVYQMPPCEGTIAIWTLKDSRVFLFSNVQHVDRWAELIYVSSSEWAKYVDADKAYKRGETSEQESIGKKAVNKIF